MDVPFFAVSQSAQAVSQVVKQVAKSKLVTAGTKTVERAVIAGGNRAANIAKSAATGVKESYKAVRQKSAASQPYSLAKRISARNEPWAKDFGKATNDGYGRLIKDLPKGHQYRNQLATMLRAARNTGGDALKTTNNGRVNLGGVVAEHIVPSGSRTSIFRYNADKFRIADFVEESTHWTQIQKGLRGKGYSIEQLEILAKQKVLKLQGLSNELRKEFSSDIKSVKDGAYVTESAAGR